MAIKDRFNNAKQFLSDAKSRTMFIIILIVLAIFFAIGYYKMKGSARPLAGMGSEVSNVPSISSIPGLGQPTREYAALQEEQNAQIAAAAERKGTSAIPTVVRTTYIGSGVSSDLSAQSGATSVIGCGVDSLKRARAAGVTASELRCRGCSAAALRAAGYTAGDLRDAGFSAAELKAAGFSAAELKAAGFSASELAAAGFSAKDLAAAGYTAGELKDAGFSAADLKAAGFSDAAVNAAGYNQNALSTGNCSAASIQAARGRGVSAVDLRKQGCSAAALRAAGYTAAELKAAGFSAKDLKDAGYSAADLRAAGFSAADLRAAGFSAKALKDAGFSAADLKAAGFSAGELRNAGFSAAELKAAGFSADDLRKAGYSASELKDAGFSPDEIRAAGYSEGDLTRAGIAAVSTKAVTDAGTGTTNLKPVIAPSVPTTTSTTTSATTPASVSYDDRPDWQKQLEKYRADQEKNMTAQQRQDLLRQEQQLMTSQANQLFSAWTPIPSQQYVVGEAPKAGAETSGQESAEAIAAKNANIYKAGTIIFAVLDTGVNSDETSPVMATIVQGPLKGSKVLGNFTRVDKKVLLQFSVLSIDKLPNSIAVNAVAIDPNTAKTALATHVDSHYMLRYGTLFASSFVSGVANAMQNAGGTVSTTPVGSIVTMPSLNPLQEAVVGLGSVGQQFSTATAPIINTPPTVEVSAGSGIGLLLMADLAVPKVVTSGDENVIPTQSN